MKSRIIIKCDISMNMGEVAGDHSDAALERIRKACCTDALKRLNEIIGDTKDITIGNPKFMITLTDDNF